MGIERLSQALMAKNAMRVDFSASVLQQEIATGVFTLSSLR